MTTNTVGRAYYNGDAVTTQFAVPFAFLHRAQVSLLVSGVSATFTWISDSMIQATVAPAAGTDNVLVLRASKADGMEATIQSGAIDPFDENSNYKQLLYRTQELTAAAALAIRVMDYQGTLAPLDAAAIPGKMLGFDGNGDPTVTTYSQAQIEAAVALAIAGLPTASASAAISLQGAILAGQTIVQANAAAVLIGASLSLDNTAPYLLTGNTTLTAKEIRLDGGKITTGSYNLTVANAVTGGDIAWLDKAGTGVVSFTNNITSRLHWFGPTGDGTTADTNPCRRWIASSSDRVSGPGKFSTDTLTIPAITPTPGYGGRITGRVLGAGPWLTQFNVIGGHDLFILSVAGGSVGAYGLEIGGFMCVGPSIATGSGYAFHHPAGSYYASHLYVHDIYQVDMGGGAVWDEIDQQGGGAFTVIYQRINSVTAGKHHFDIAGGNTCQLELCYAHAVSNNYCGYRIHSQAVLISCNGIDSGKVWGIFGDYNGALTTDAGINGGAIALPSDGVTNYSSVTLINTNVEAASAIGIICKNGSVNMDASSAFDLDAGTSNVVAVLCMGGITKPGILAGTRFINTGTYAQGCPLWQAGTIPAFACIEGTASNAAVPVWSFDALIQINTSSDYITYLGLVGGVYTAARSFNALQADIVKVSSGTPFGQVTPAGATTLTAAGAGTPILTDSTTTGGTGATAYTVADIVKALKDMKVFKA